MSSILLAVQGGNWQRGGGRGEKPKRIERPKDIQVTSSDIKSTADLAARREKLKKERQRRATQAK